MSAMQKVYTLLGITEQTTIEQAYALFSEYASDDEIAQIAPELLPQEVK